MKLFSSCSSCFSFSGSKHRNSIEENKEDEDEDFRVFTYGELKQASNGFNQSNMIGKGSFGSVYRGQLKDGGLVAIKVLSVEMDSMRGEREFTSELASLSNLRHANLVRLRGCCVNGAQRFLIYEYMQNNSLSHTFLGSEQKRMRFTWKHRRDVVIGVAQALAYLHDEVNPHVIHRDIKAGNILLDDNFSPKVADFGLAKLFRDDASYVSTRVAGTIGYLAPEYAISGHLSRKSDVYSFGVLVLEVLSGCKVMDVNNTFKGEQYLVDKAWEMYKDGRLLEMMDPIMNGDFDKEEANRLLKFGLICVQELSRMRPRMTMAVKILSGEVDISKVEVFQPGLFPDLNLVRTGSKRRHGGGFHLQDSLDSTTISTVSSSTGFFANESSSSMETNKKT
ncbi:putative serine/threonine-protein kinase isoform X2 [Impatiens glandulifera]|uniref:putative serine/threonine-protein kinase isoform X2 n=1 Tax=Impatiens glandulifera TaxID=253017 RepID=UPI001FB10F0F|nr:putative serine/threonine-protein kinase isoform X2 [Impatiens glandulifera]